MEDPRGETQGAEDGEAGRRRRRAGRQEGQVTARLEINQPGIIYKTKRPCLDWVEKSPAVKNPRNLSRKILSNLASG